MKRIETLVSKVESYKPRSAWNTGVKDYALELLEELTEAINGGWCDADVVESPKMLEKALLNGATDWSHYSEGGCALIHNREIAERLCSPSELKRTDYGRKDPNPP